MSKRAKIILGVLAIIIIGGLAWRGMAKPKVISGDPIKFGAILPLSGPVSIWGENVKNGMEIARAEMDPSGDKISVVYGDSQGNPALAVTEFQKMSDVDGVDMVFSIFSRMSVPLVSLAKNKDLPYMMSIVSASGATGDNGNTFRFYSDADQYVDPHLDWLSKDKYDSIALLTINDEFGADVVKVIRQRLVEKGIKIVADETFLPNSVDLRTQLTKIKSTSPKAIIFVGGVPVELSSTLKQKNELGIKADLIEASANLANILANPEMANGIKLEGKSLAEGVYTIAFPFTMGITGQDFKVKYKEVYGKEANYAAAFGYDMVKMVSLANGRDGVGLPEKIVSLGKYESLNGPVDVQSNGEINPPTYSVLVKDGVLVPVK